MKWSKQIKRGGSWRRDEPSWMKRQTALLSVYSLFASYDPCSSKGLFRTFQMHRVSGAAALWSWRPKSNHTQAASAAKGMWWSSSEPLYVTIPLFQGSLDTFDDYIVVHVRLIIHSVKQKKGGALGGKSHTVTCMQKELTTKLMNLDFMIHWSLQSVEPNQKWWRSSGSYLANWGHEDKPITFRRINLYNWLLGICVYFKYIWLCRSAVGDNREIQLQEIYSRFIQTK